MREKTPKNVAVVGMGYFGYSVVEALAETGINVMACDKEEAPLQAVADYATQLLCVDVTDEKAIRRIGLGNYDVVVLAMGEDFEAALIAAMIAKEQGADWVIAKARGMRQKKILQSIGVDEVILPEHEMGCKVARKLSGYNITDILDESDYYSIVEMRPQEDWVGKTLRQADIRRKHNLTVLAIRRGSKLTIPVPPDKVLGAEDILIVLSEQKD